MQNLDYLNVVYFFDTLSEHSRLVQTCTVSSELFLATVTSYLGKLGSKHQIRTRNVIVWHFGGLISGLRLINEAIGPNVSLGLLSGLPVAAGSMHRK